MSDYRQTCMDECPARGVGLLHMHASDCKHPHSAAYCCECFGEFIHPVDCRHVAAKIEPPIPVVRTVSTTKDHVYLFTIAGFCGECGGVEDDHPIVGLPDPMTGCDVDHNSLTSKMLAGDAGLERSRCPRCNVMVEPKTSLGTAAKGDVLLAVDRPVGPPYGLGRSWYGNGELSTRDKTRLTFLIDHVVRSEQP